MIIKLLLNIYTIFTTIIFKNSNILDPITNEHKDPDNGEQPDKEVTNNSKNNRAGCQRIIHDSMVIPIMIGAKMTIQNTFL